MLKKWISGLLVLAMLAVLCVGSVSAENPYEEIFGFEGWEVGVKPGSADDNKAHGWDDKNQVNGSLYKAEVVDGGGESGHALKWTCLEDGNMPNLMLDLTADSGAKTDWTDALYLNFYVDTSKYSNQAQIGVRLLEQDPGDKEQVWVLRFDRDSNSENYGKSDAKIQVQLGNGNWAAVESNWGRAYLPEQYVGWVRIPLDVEASWMLAWWDSHKGSNDTLDLTNVTMIGLQIQGGAAGDVIVDSFSLQYEEDTTAATTTTTTKATTTTTKATTTKQTTAEATTAADQQDNGGLSTGAIVGIVVAAVVVIGGGCAAFVILKKKKNSGNDVPPTTPGDGDANA